MSNTIKFIIAGSFCWYSVEGAFQVISIPSQISVRDGFQTDFSSFIIKSAFFKGSLTKFECNKVILYELISPKPS